MLNSFQTSSGMTARPENSIALQTFAKLNVSFTNVIGYQAANILRGGIDNRDVTMNTSWKRSGVRWTDADFSDDLSELQIQMVRCDKNQPVGPELFFNCPCSCEHNPIFFQMRIKPVSGNINFDIGIKPQNAQPFCQFTQGSVCSETKCHWNKNIWLRLIGWWKEKIPVCFHIANKIYRT